MFWQNKFFQKAIKKIVFFFDFSGAVILLYHSVGYSNEFFTVRPEDFKKQMSYLKEKKFKVISLAELGGLLARNETIGKKTVVITFDDGYEDNFLMAYPILKKNGFPATIFVVSSLIDKTIKARRGTDMNILSERQMKELAHSGLIKFGSHANNHQKLAKLEEKEVEKELIDSKRMLSNILREEVASLAYPFGSYNEQVKKIAGKHFKIAGGVGRGLIHDNQDRWQLPRFSIDHKVSFWQFKFILWKGSL